MAEDSHTLTVAELPAHTHGRGTTDIVGRFWDICSAGADSLGSCNGVFVNNVVSGNAVARPTQMTWAGTDGIEFKASRNWTGTSESIGSGTSINILNPYKVAYCFIRLS